MALLIRQNNVWGKCATIPHVHSIPVWRDTPTNLSTTFIFKPSDHPRPPKVITQLFISAVDINHLSTEPIYNNGSKISATVNPQSQALHGSPALT